MNIYNSEKRAVFTPLTENTVCDVLVIGGGASGLLCAYKLCLLGFTVCLAEKDVIAARKTSYNGGLIFMSRTPRGNTTKRWGGDHSASVKEYADSFLRLKDICHKISDSSYKETKALFYTENSSGMAVERMKKEYRHRFFNGEKCTFLTWREAMKLYSFNIAAGILSESAAMHNPVKFCEKLGDYLSLKGGMIFENTEITAVNRDPTDRLFRSCDAKGITVTSRAVVDCRGASEICSAEEKKGLTGKTLYFLTTQPINDFTGWHEGSIITDDGRNPFFLRRDEANRAVMILSSSSIFIKLGKIYDDYIHRYMYALFRSMFFGMEDIRIEDKGKFECKLPKNCGYGSKEDPSLKGFFYICSNNITGLQDSEIMATKTAAAVRDHLKN